MSMRHDHEVTVIIGITIQHDKGRVPAPENQVVGIILCTEFLTKEAARRLVTQNIGHTPRCPDDIGHAPAPPLHTFCHSVPSFSSSHTLYQVRMENALRSQTERTVTYGLVL